MTHRSCLRWKPTGKLFKTVGLRWVPTGKIFTSSTTKVDSEPQNGSNDDITHQFPEEGDFRYADEPGIIELDVPALQACCILSRPRRLRKDLTYQNLLLDRNTLIVKIAGLGLDRVSIMPIKKYNHERKRERHEELNLWKKLKDKKVQTNLLDEEKENDDEVVDVCPQCNVYKISLAEEWMILGLINVFYKTNGAEFVAIIASIDNMFTSFLFKQEMELTLVGLQDAGKTSLLNFIAYGYVQSELTNDEVEYLKLFEEEIEVRLKRRNQMRRWEMYVNGRPLGPRRERPE
ncbi:putative reverse transcriptase domain-containing protein [Tanacetum coccineum]